MKRILFAAFLLMASLPVSALAAPGDAVEVELKGVERGAVVEGTLSLTATASSAAGIKRIQISIEGQVVESAEPSGVKQSVDISYGWVSSLQIGSSNLAPNGEYLIVARASANGGGDATSSVGVIVDNPAAVPAGLSARATREGASLMWEPNPEPDILGYRVERGVGAEFEILGQTRETSIVDPVGPGTYSYRITAIRSSAARPEGRPSAPSKDVVVSIQAAAAGKGGSRGDGAFARTRGFVVKDSAIAPKGLPSGASLPGRAGLPDIPDPAAAWGTYEPKLPYEIPKGGIPLNAAGDFSEPASWTPVPPDGLRWVAAGALLIALAVLLRLSALRLRTIEGASAADL